MPAERHERWGRQGERRRAKSESRIPKSDPAAAGPKTENRTWPAMTLPVLTQRRGGAEAQPNQRGDFSPQRTQRTPSGGRPTSEHREPKAERGPKTDVRQTLDWFGRFRFGFRTSVPRVRDRASGFGLRASDLGFGTRASGFGFGTRVSGSWFVVRASDFGFGKRASASVATRTGRRAAQFARRGRVAPILVGLE